MAFKPNSRRRRTTRWISRSIISPGRSARIVFYRLGVCRGQSVCILLCDSWFDGKGESEGFLRRDDWHMSFHPGRDDEIEEITDLSRWLRRVRRGRSFHDLDFCMTLATIEEIRPTAVRLPLRTLCPDHAQPPAPVFGTARVNSRAPAVSCQIPGLFCSNVSRSRHDGLARRC